jgi:trehalose 6-phosphate phosphatase
MTDDDNSSPAGTALFFDFDRTLVDIAATPDAVLVSAELRDALARLRDRLDGAVAAEILPVGYHKGGAIDVLMDLPPFAGRTPIVFGDDVTGEDAFRIVDARGGYSVKVGPEQSAATFRLPHARNVRALAMQWAEELPADILRALKQL